MALVQFVLVNICSANILFHKVSQSISCYQDF